MLYAHGYVSKDVPVAITPDSELVISIAVSQGFAVAVSSFSENGYVIKDGTQRTHQDIVIPAIAAMTGDPSGAVAIASITQTPVPFASGPELFESIATALVGAAGYPEILELTHGAPYFDNTATEYTGALPAPTLAFINAHVQRFAGSPAGSNALGHNYTPTGDLRIPALTLSTSRDPVVPGFHRLVYAQDVAARGAADLLVQRSVPGTFGGYGHCTFTPQELTDAFLDLVVWGESGIKPTP